ncbi:DUF2207 domain-containing protein [Clostridium merdae]|uniref:DUF2207 domain-containing protein n=1 Tax=Clostridium merdae TaxID=1958780 RepID=UPI000A26BC0D|nr:DUF2207 domain-containing protein [Clostridium merdae]
MKSTKKRSVLLSLFLVVLFVFTAAPVFAKEDSIPSIQIDAALREDGSAVITEVWNVSGVRSGTEYFKAIKNLSEGMSVHSFTVKDETGKTYQTLSDWDTNRSREEKAGTCGILKKSDGYELCWGIGNYGDHQYTIEYVLDGLVKNYGDYAGFYHLFVSDLSSSPKSVAVTVRMPNTSFNEGNSRIWGYGFEGEVYVNNNGTLFAVTEGSLNKSHKFNLLCRFDNDMFPQALKADITFEELQNKANNEEKSESTALFIVLGILGVLLIGGAVAFAFFYSRYKLADGSTVRLESREKIEPSWLIPFGGNIPAACAAMAMLRRDISCDKLLGAYFIRWQRAGYIQIEKRINEDKRKKKEPEEIIVFHPENTPTLKVEQSLYAILSSFADADGILWSSQIEKKADKIFDKLTLWSEEVKKDGEKELIRLGVAARDDREVVRFTSTGFDQAVRLIGLEKYLIGMKKQQEEGLAPQELWGDFLVFAALFDIGEQVLNSMKVLNPSYYEEFSGMYGYHPAHMVLFMSMTNHISSSVSPNSNGTGGAASTMAGGGFSGGGGGGSR